MADIDSASLLDDPRVEDPRARAGAAPIEGGGAPDIRDEPEFADLEFEFRKMETSGPAAVDWASLNRRTIEVIEQRSKDLVLATRLAYGLFREEGYKGLSVGIAILQGMVCEHWDSLYPPPSRERGRAGSLDWLAEKLAPLVRMQPPGEDQKLAALQAHDDLVRLAELLSSRLVRFPVTLRPLIDALEPAASEVRAAIEAKARKAEERRSRTKTRQAAGRSEVTEAEPASAAPVVTPAPEPAEASAGDSAATGSAEAIDTSGAAPTPDTGGQAQEALHAAFIAASRAAAELLGEDPTDPRAYVASRFALWGPVRTAPPATSGRSALPPPHRARLAKLLRTLRSAGDHAGLIATAERAFLASPFWLDAQFILAQAMQEAGPAYAAAHAAVVAETGAFLRRIDGLVSLTFSDGTRFASPEAAGWIAQAVLPAAMNDRDGGEAKQLADRASALGRSGNVLSGLKLLADRAERAADARQRFAAQLDVGEYCLAFDLLQPLIPLLDDLQQTARERALDSWEPQLAVALASLSWRTCSHRDARRHLDERDIQERKSRIVASLARIDVAMAAELSSPKPARPSHSGPRSQKL